MRKSSGTFWKARRRWGDERKDKEKTEGETRVQKIAGVYVTNVSPFREDSLEVDVDAYLAHSTWYGEKEDGGLIPFGTNVDKIADFSAKDDSIWLDNAVFTRIGKGEEDKPGKLAKAMFWTGKAAHD